MILHRKYIIYWLCDTHWNWDADCSAWRTSQWLSGSARSCEAARLRSIPCDRNASVARPVCVGGRACVEVCVSYYGVFRVYSGSLVCVESGQRGCPKFYMTPQCSWVLSKKKLFRLFFALYENLFWYLNMNSAIWSANFKTHIQIVD